MLSFRSHGLLILHASLCNIAVSLRVKDRIVQAMDGMQRSFIH